MSRPLFQSVLKILNFEDRRSPLLQRMEAMKNKLQETKKSDIFSFSNTLYSRRMRWAGPVARMGETRNAYRIWVGKPEGKRPQGRPRRRWWTDRKSVV
jgi:hypothetical protein